jgi:type IV pilus assembly protein PilW
MKLKTTLCHQSGFTLVELMVASTIGLIVLAVFGEVFLSGQQSYRTQTGMGALQENGRFALFFLQRELRMAGFPRLSNMGVPGLASPALVVVEGGVGASDQITAQYLPATGYVDASGVAVPNASDDCLGGALPVGGTLVFSHFSVSNGALRCEGSSNAGSPQPLVGDDSARVIESMQVLYGEDTDGDSYANVYRRADQVVTLANVTAVRIGVLVSSGEIVGTVADTKYYAVLDAAPAQPVNDSATTIDERQYGRRVFNTTVQIRNLNPG